MDSIRKNEGEGTVQKYYWELGRRIHHDKDFMDYYMAYNGILWNSDLSLGSPDCEKLEKVLEKLLMKFKMKLQNFLTF